MKLYQSFYWILLLLVLPSCVRHDGRLKEIGRIAILNSNEKLSYLIVVSSSSNKVEYLKTGNGKEAIINLHEIYYEYFDDDKPSLKPDLSNASVYAENYTAIRVVEKAWNNCLKKGNNPDIVMPCVYKNDGFKLDSTSIYPSSALIYYDYKLKYEDIEGKSIKNTYNKMLDLINKNSDLKLTKFK